MLTFFLLLCYPINYGKMAIKNNEKDNCPRGEISRHKELKIYSKGNVEKSKRPSTAQKYSNQLFF